MKWLNALSGPAILASIYTLMSMYLGGFVTYAPTVSASEIQNIYLSRMFWFGGISIAFQIASLVIQIYASWNDWKTHHSLSAND